MNPFRAVAGLMKDDALRHRIVPRKPENLHIARLAVDFPERVDPGPHTRIDRDLRYALHQSESAIVVDTAELPPDEVHFGSRVTVAVRGIGAVRVVASAIVGARVVPGAVGHAAHRRAPRCHPAVGS